MRTIAWSPLKRLETRIARLRPSLRLNDRSFKIRGMDCVEKVANLRQALGPLAGGADRVSYDALNAKLSVAAPAAEVPGRSDPAGSPRDRDGHTTLRGLFAVSCNCFSGEQAKCTAQSENACITVEGDGLRVA